MEELSYLTYDNVEMKINLYLPETTNEKVPLVVFFFGGGWNSGTTKQFEAHAIELSRLGIAVALPDYRVLSKHSTTIDTAIKDAIYAMEFLYNNATKYNINNTKIAIGGGSAGGHLAVSTVLLDTFIPSNFNYKDSVELLLLCNPVTDVVMFKKLSPAIKNSSYDCEMMSPVHNISGKLPDTLIFHGNSDITVPFSTAIDFKNKYEQNGGSCKLFEYEKRGHGFFNLSAERVIQDHYDVLGHMVNALFEKGFFIHKEIVFKPN